MMTIATFIKESPGKGVGVFSVNAVKKGETVWVRNDQFTRFYTDEEVNAMPPIQKAFVHKYAYTVPGREHLWEYDMDDGRFMNHSDDPNTLYDDEKGWAVRDIAAGEEITCDYSTFDTQPMNFRNVEKK